MNLQKISETLKQIDQTLSEGKIASLTLENGFSEVVEKYKQYPWKMPFRINVFGIERSLGFFNQPTLIVYIPEIDSCVSLNAPGDLISANFVESIENTAIYKEKLDSYKKKRDSDPKTQKSEILHRAVEELNKSREPRDKLAAILLGSCLVGIDRMDSFSEEADIIIRTTAKGLRKELQEALLFLLEDRFKAIEKRNNLMTEVENNLKNKALMN
jgi:hypothetical protein